MFITFRRATIIKWLTLVTVAIFGLTAIYGGEVESVFYIGGTRLLPIYRVDREDKVVALTFDAAYGADKTAGIMEILDRYGVEATFFLVGFWVDKYPDLVREIHARGYEIGSHSDTHGYMSRMSEDAIRRDLTLSVQKITSITGSPVEVFRPPYGDYDNELIRISRELELYPIQWSVDSLDWKGISGEEIISRVVSRIHEGAIVLFHNNSDHILDALPGVIELLTERGYTFATVGELIYREGYEMDHRGFQIRKI